MISQTLQTAAMAILEISIHQAIKLDRKKCSGLRSLSGCAFLINITEPSLRIYLVIDSTGQPRLQSIYEGEITTRVSGTASEFFALTLSEDPGTELINSPLEISGESNRLLEISQIFKNLDLDWEAYLTEYLGDIASHRIGSSVRRVHQWNKLTKDSLLRQIREYIHEEARLSPSKLELEDFYTDTQKLRLAADRLASLTKKLRKAL